MKKPIYLIMGGYDKGSSYKPLASLVKRSVRTLLLIGEASRKIAKELEGCTRTVFCHTLSKAVRYAQRTSRSGDVVLLSPGCASFDQFRDFEHRGSVFKSLVKNRR